MVVRGSEQQNKFRRAAQSRFWLVLGPFWARVGVRVRVGDRVRVRVRVGSTPVPRKRTRKCFLPRKREQPTAPKIRATQTLGKLAFVDVLRIKIVITSTRKVSMGVGFRGSCRGSR